MKVRRGWVVLGALSLTACGQLSKGARQYFVDKYSCPAERVALAEVKGARPSDVFAADWRAATPPEEVKDDPARLAQWRATEAERRKGWESWINSSRLFDVTGCGHRVVLACRPPGQRSSSGAPAICNEPPVSGG